MTTPQDDTLNQVDRNKNDLGLEGADAVEKTTYVGDVHGAHVGAEQAKGVEVTAPVNRPGGLSVVAWIAVAAGAVALAIYASGLF